MPNWQRLERGKRPSLGGPSVGIQARKGTLSLNAAAFESLGSPDAVEILFDPELRMIGFRAAAVSGTTYPVRKQGPSSTYLISGKALVRRMNIDISVPRRFPAVLVEGVLSVDLREFVAAESGRTPSQAGS